MVPGTNLQTRPSPLGSMSPAQPPGCRQVPRRVYGGGENRGVL